MAKVVTLDGLQEYLNQLLVNFGGSGATALWTNASPTSTFAAQSTAFSETIPVSSPQFDALFIPYYLSNETNRICADIFFLDKDQLYNEAWTELNGELTIISYGSDFRDITLLGMSTTCIMRSGDYLYDANYEEYTGISWSTGYSDSTSNVKYCIPLAIYGVNF